MSIRLILLGALALGEMNALAAEHPGPAPWAACEAPVLDALHLFFRHEHDDEWICTVEKSATALSFDCRGRCLDRSCHDDACELWNPEVIVRITADPKSVPDAWRRRQDADKVGWSRAYGGVRATLESEVLSAGTMASIFGESWRKQRLPIPPALPPKVRHALDRCLARP